MQKNQKILIGLVIVLLVLAGILYLAKNKLGNKGGSDRSNQPASVNKVNVDFSKDPENFPSSIPIEAGAQVTQNYNAAAPSGQYQATKTFVTKASLAENLSLYTNYLKSNGWTVEGTVDESNYKSVAGKKDNEKIQVNIDENKTSKVKTVSIIYTKTVAPVAN